MEDRQMYKENEHYELIPDPNSSQEWQIRIMKGDYTETLLQYGGIRVDGTEEDPLLTFDFRIISSPDPDLSTSDQDLQQFAGDLLVSIIESGIQKGELKTREV